MNYKISIYISLVVEYYKLKTIAFYIFVATIMFVNLKGSENENEWSCSCCNCLKKEKKNENNAGNNEKNNAGKNESVGENVDGQSIIVKKNDLWNKRKTGYAWFWFS